VGEQNKHRFVRRRKLVTLRPSARSVKSA
jgi:hypothetical protein